MNRYNRHIILSEIGSSGQNKLNNAKVLVVGAGGLGCPILQYLAAAGIGNIGIIDFDIVEVSNLQRQILFGNSSLGKNKAEAAKQRLQDLNNTILITAYPERLTNKNAITLFNQYDIIVDGTDNFETRYLINDASIITNKPLVFGAIYKFEGQVSVFNHKNGPSYRCLFSKEPNNNTLNCSEVGVLGILPGIIGTMQANEVLKIVLEIGNVLSGKLLCYNALTLQSYVLKINKSETEINTILEGQADFNSKTIHTNCGYNIKTVSIKDIMNSDDSQFIDVRAIDELPKIETLKVTSIPLNELENNLDKIEIEKEKMIFCQSGIRSKHAVSILKQLKISNCYAITEGASEISKHIKEQHIL